MAHTAAKAEAAGKTVMNRCPKIKYGRLSSEISWMRQLAHAVVQEGAPFGRGIQRMSLNRTTLGGGTTGAATRAEKDAGGDR